MSSHASVSAWFSVVLLLAILLLVGHPVWCLTFDCPPKCHCSFQYSHYSGRQIAHADCSSQSLVSFPTPVAPGMESIDISENNISHIPANVLQTLHGLQILNCSNNRLEVLGDSVFQNSSSLLVLKLNGNMLRDISSNTFSPLTKNLKDLRLTTEDVPTALFSESPFIVLKHLELQTSQLVLTTGMFLRLRRVSTISLHAPNVATLPMELFRGCSRARTIRITAHSLTSIASTLLRGPSRLAEFELETGPQFEFPEEFVFSGVEDVRTLSMVGMKNLVRGMFDEMFDLERLSVENILELSPDLFRSFTGELTHLKLANSSLCSITDTLFHGLITDSIEELNLSRNCLFSLPSGWLSKMTNLYVLDLSQNNLIDFSVLHSYEFVPLRELNLRGNRIRYLTPFTALSELQRLDLSENELSALPSGLLYKVEIQYFNVANNLLSRLDNDLFMNHRALLSANISSNKLTNIPDGFLGDSNQLRFLDLSHNNIKDLPGKFLPSNTMVEKVFLHGNDGLECGCSLMGVVFSNRHPRGISSDIQLSGVCSKPVDLEGVHLEELKLTQICTDDAIHELEDMLLFTHADDHAVIPTEPPKQKGGQTGGGEHNISIVASVPGIAETAQAEQGASEQDSSVFHSGSSLEWESETYISSAEEITPEFPRGTILAVETTLELTDEVVESSDWQYGFSGSIGDWDSSDLSDIYFYTSMENAILETSASTDMSSYDDRTASADYRFEDEWQSFKSTFEIPASVAYGNSNEQNSDFITLSTSQWTVDNDDRKSSFFGDWPSILEHGEDRTDSIEVDEIIRPISNFTVDLYGSDSLFSVVSPSPTAPSLSSPSSSPLVDIPKNIYSSHPDEPSTVDNSFIPKYTSSAETPTLENTSQSASYRSSTAKPTAETATFVKNDTSHDINPTTPTEITSVKRPDSNTTEVPSGEAKHPNSGDPSIYDRPGNTSVFDRQPTQHARGILTRTLFIVLALAFALVLTAALIALGYRQRTSRKHSYYVNTVATPYKARHWPDYERLGNEMQDDSRL